MERAETRAFQAEAKELLGLVVHSLYSHPEIFLRELISNASDALDKLRYEALRRGDAAAASQTLSIRIELDPARRVLAVSDDGIGMSREEVAQNLGTIARSGTRAFLDAARAGAAPDSTAPAADLPSLIGQFGVGFYASFMVASEVVVETRRDGDARATRWRSRGDGEYTLEDGERNERGTRIELALKPVDAESDDPQDYADPELLRALVRKYSDFVEWPIEMAASHFAGDGTLRRRVAADGVEVAILNSQKPLWSRPKDEIAPAEHAQFFRHLTHAFSDPVETIHFKAEGGAEYTALLYLPGERPPDLFHRDRERSRVALYVRHVFVMADCEELLPAWLRFVCGVVDSADLPLNVSREILQENRQLAQIRRRLTRKVLDALASLLAGRRADYLRFWRAFGTVLKEGLVIDREHAQALAALALYPSTREAANAGAQASSAELATLGEYVARMSEGQSEIYVLRARDLASAWRSPHLETLSARGREVLLAVDPIDEWVFESLREFEGRRIALVDRGELDLDDAAQKLAREDAERQARALLERLETELAPSVARVRFSSRLVGSPAVLVDEPGTLGPNVERWMRETGREPPPRKRALELNPGHPLIEKLQALHAADPRSARVRELAELLHAQALIAEGSPLPDPARFGQLFADWMLAASPPATSPA